MNNKLFIIFAMFFLLAYVQVEGIQGPEKTTINYDIRKANFSDKEQLKNLHIKVAAISGGLLRLPDEITDVYIDNILKKSLEQGIILVAEYDNAIIGSVFKYKEDMKKLEHVLFEGTVLVDPDYQGNGIGTALYSTLLNEVKDHRPDILRVNLKTRASSPAIRLYERLGFKKEGECINMFKNEAGEFESVVTMAWFNPNFKGH